MSTAIRGSANLKRRRNPYRSLGCLGSLPGHILGALVESLFQRRLTRCFLLWLGGSVFALLDTLDTLLDLLLDKELPLLFKGRFDHRIPKDTDLTYYNSRPYLSLQNLSA